MRRPFHIFARALTVLSLLLLVATAVLWVRSYWATDRLTWANAGGSRTVWTARGHVQVWLLLADWSGAMPHWRGLTYDRDVPLPPFDGMRLLSAEPGDRHAQWAWGGFVWHQKYRPPPRGVQYVNVIVPCWAVAVALGLWPTWRAVAYVRRRRRGPTAGVCAACGYDLRATPERCPECGSSAGGGARSAA